MKEIVSLQKQYFLSNATKSIDARLQWIKRLKKEIIDHEKEVIEALFLDLKKSEFEAYATEVGFVLSSFTQVIKQLKKWSKPKKVRNRIHQPLSKNFIINVPYGVTLIIGPYNYPFQLIMEPLLGALASGNTIILKPSESTPHTNTVIKKIIRNVFPKEYVTVIEGDADTTQELLKQDLDFIFFTGSVRVGSIIGEIAGKRLIPCILELGGKSPTIVHKDAAIKHAAKRIVWGKFINNGQTCIAPDFIYVHKDKEEELLKELVAEINRSFTEKPCESEDYSRIIDVRQFDRLVKLIDTEKLHFGGKTNRDDLYIQPTILKHITWDDPIMKEEIFGPILPVLTYRDINKVKEVLESKNNPLALYVFSSNKSLSEELIYDIPSGGACINDTISHITNPDLPFGGMGTSGMGSYHGKYSYLAFSHQKSVSKKPVWIDLKLVYPPYKNKANIVRKILK